MAEIRIDVYRDGEYIKTIERRLREQGGCPMVRFRGVNHLVIDDCEIHVEGLATAAGSQGTGELDPEQTEIVHAKPEARLIVNAGPGTGKTRVACARVAELIRTGVEPSNIWIISFTRTAVSEVRDRVGLLASEESRAAAVKVTTLDSHAWYFREGFEEETGGVFSGYEENIERAIEVLRRNDPMVQEYLETLQHVVIDEAQDLVGVRAEMLELLIRCIPRSCGVSVFTDDAQAIYGFSEADEDRAEGDDESAGSATLPERLRRKCSLGFVPIELNTVHRTNSRRLKRLFTETRQLVVEPGDATAKIQRLRGEIEAFADELLEDPPQEEMQGRNDLLALFRRRAEVLIASARLWRAGVPHRIRMSGYPPSIHPWVATLLWDLSERHLRRAQFEELWADRMGGTGSGGCAPEDAWALMWRTAGTSGDRIEMRRLRAQLSRGPPRGFVPPDIGGHGPILGTIHASKGREAPYVDLMLPPEYTGRCDLEEEARVLFVGATRARAGFRVGKAPWCSARSLDSGRVYQFGSANQSPRAQIEIGRHGDLDEAMLVSDRTYTSAADVEDAQDLLRRGVPESFVVLAQQEAALDHSYVLYAEVDGRRITLGGLNGSVKQDLWSIARVAATRWGPAALRPPPQLRYIRVVGVRSVVLPEDHPDLTQVHPPFDETGMFLAPVLCSFSTAFFHRRY